MHVLLIFACLLLLTGCELVAPQTDDPHRLITYEGSEPPTAHHDPVDVVGGVREGDVFSVAVRYSGGCADHDFRLYWDGNVAESFPEQVWFDLAHDDHDDACDALVGDTLVFDLSPLSQRVPNASTIIHVEPLGNGQPWTWCALPCTGNGCGVCSED